MSEEGCTHNCSTCSSNCKSKDFKFHLHPKSTVKHVIGVVSGKGGVGKSLVTSLLASKTAKKGLRAAILDADITGPSIPTSFGSNGERVYCDETGLIAPETTESGIQLMSMNFLLKNENDPVLWRGSMINGFVKKFWEEVFWDNVDYMFVDMPPGTGDVPLTVFQSIPLDGIIIVSSPQQLVRVIVEKAVKMAQTMKIPVYGLIENMSYVQCPDCGKQIKVFGDSHVEQISKEFHIPLLARIPIDPKISHAVDSGKIETLEAEFLDAALAIIQN
ncbi:MAG: Mrp/NBP35 family ATP-binding protein [Treponema berlinense]|uniref:Mrp/NBP35 family ATP-binding protein n=1 Tax=Treponema berlinense TaxID=225004 RepID=UPI002A820D90|nr:Mrp/NBP35 family ATP-binding protein [Treponema berlinense]MDY3707534.1 Mrp/NBP35 family ATP-binding protein [Treponema berlinense]